MGKIIDNINTAYEKGETTVSFEFFPAKTEAGVNNLLRLIEDMTFHLRPTFVTLTWRSAFKDESLWLKIGQVVQCEFGVDVLLHLTCHLPTEDLRRILRNARKAGIRNILALRGDPPIGQERWKPKEGCLKNAVELVRLIREEHGDYFCIAIAGYAEVHIESWNNQDLPPSEQCLELDLKRLKEKVDAGGDFIITQFFFDIDIFLQFVRRCRKFGINVPILPGYLPIQNYKSYRKFTEWCKTKVPKHIQQNMEVLKTNDDKVREFGISEATAVCRRILEEFPTRKSLHFYSMNMAHAVTEILTRLDLLPKSILKRRTSVGRGINGQTTNGLNGEVRPIFWANRQSSYTVRTKEWDEHPNGRWGDFRSPAYGELSEYYLSYKRPKIDRIQIWGIPENEKHVQDVFVKYIEKKIPCLPWCEQAVAEETSIISSNLKFLNENGFWTINSQPSVNGRPSEDLEVGWGDDGGHIYQKAYVEFFCSESKLHALLETFEKYPHLAYQATDYAGKRTFCNYPGGLNTIAVTWGVFPGREIIQPTIVDKHSFEVWKDEAFELWSSMWSSTYVDENGEPKKSEDPRYIKAASLLDSIKNSYFLVNVVDNDYMNGHIFEIFRKVINKGMEPGRVRDRLDDLERENERLQEVVFNLNKRHESDKKEIELLQKELEQARVMQDFLREKVLIIVYSRHRK